MTKIEVDGVANKNINVFYFNRRKIKKLKRKGYIFYKVRSGKLDVLTTLLNYQYKAFGDFYKRVSDGNYVIDVKVDVVLFWKIDDYFHIPSKREITLSKMFSNKSEFLKWKLIHD